MTTNDPLEQFAFLRRLTPEQRAVVGRTTTEVSFPVRATLFEEGKPAVGCWLLRSGLVSLEAAPPGRAPVVVQTLWPGDVVGLSWLMPQQAWLFTAVAREPVTALAVDTERLRVLTEADPALGYAVTVGLLEAMATRLQATRARLLDLFGSPRER